MWSNNRDWSVSEFYQTNGDHRSVTEAWGKSKKKDEKKLLSKMSGNKYTSLKRYLREILQSSLITSIPEITKSKSWTKKIIKICIFILCLIGFIYQTLDFLWLYLSYPTVVNVIISNPFEIIAPAITVCNRNRERRSVICSEGDKECTFLAVEGFCDLYPKYCRSYKTPLTGIPFVFNMIQDEFYWEKAETRAHTTTIIKHCKMFIEGETYHCSQDYRRIPVTMSYGEPNFCYAIESLWGKPDIEPSIYPNTFSIELELYTEADEYAITTEPILMQIAVHNPRKLANPFVEGIPLKGGTQYDAIVSVTEKKLLPAPYDTNCTDYLKIWKENNGTGPINDLMCVEYCKLNTLLKNGTCIDKNVNYPHMERLCQREEVTTTSDLIEECSKTCEAACSDYSYEVRYEAVNNYDLMCGDEWCRVSKIKVIYDFKQYTVTKFQYQPKFESVEMFSYIGGYMGMWLGLSLVSLFDFIETIAYLLYYPIGHLRWKAKKKRQPLHTMKTIAHY